MTSLAAQRGRTAISPISPARSAQWLPRSVAAAGASVAQVFRAFDAAADLHRGSDDRALVLLMIGRD